MTGQLLTLFLQLLTAFAAFSHWILPGYEKELEQINALLALGMQERFPGGLMAPTVLTQCHHESFPAISVGHNPLNTLQDPSQLFEPGWRLFIGIC